MTINKNVITINKILFTLYVLSYVINLTLLKVFPFSFFIANSVRTKYCVSYCKSLSKNSYYAFTLKCFSIYSWSSRTFIFYLLYAEWNLRNIFCQKLNKIGFIICYIQWVTPRNRKSPKIIFPIVSNWKIAAFLLLNTYSL